MYFSAQVCQMRASGGGQALQLPRKVQFTTSTERVKRGKVFADDCWYRRLHAYPMSECGTSRIGCYQAGYSDRR